MNAKTSSLCICSRLRYAHLAICSLERNNHLANEASKAIASVANKLSRLELKHDLKAIIIELMM